MEKSLSVRVQTNDPQSREVCCAVLARCAAPLTTSPARVDFGSLPPERLAEASQALRVTLATGQPQIAVERIETRQTSDAFVVRARPGLPSANFVSLLVGISPALERGEYSDQLELRLPGSTASIRVALHVQVSAGVSIIPSAVRLQKDERTGQFRPVRFLAIDRRHKPRLGRIRLAAGQRAVRIEDGGALGAERRRFRLVFDQEAGEWSDETLVQLVFDGDETRYAIKVTKPN